MYIKILILIASIFFNVLLSRAEGTLECLKTEDTLTKNFADKYEQLEILSAFNLQLKYFESLGIKRSFCKELQGNLDRKFSNNENPLNLSPSNIIEHGIYFESFRIETYLSSGVAPKCYFGFFDERGSTAEFERILRITIIDAVRIANKFAAKLNLKSRITEQEVALTFLAEGGALLLTNPEDSPNRVHPVRNLGLDNFRIGFAHYPELVEEFDRFFGTKLGSITVSFFGQSILLRPMSFRESILTTTLMYLYEKELTANSIQSQSGVELMSLSLHEQFISTSLVYNSGIMFSLERVKQIALLNTGEYLALINNKTNNRPKLPVYFPIQSLELLKKDHHIPTQRTSWSAVYHILQRYGTWLALEKFSTTFKNGSFVARE